MTRPSTHLALEVETLIERGKTISPVSDVVRARSLARARAAVVAAVTPYPEPASFFSRHRRILPIAVAASVALAVGTAGAVVVLRARATRGPAASAPVRPAVAPHGRVRPSEPAAPPAAPVVAPPAAAPAAAPQASLTAKPPHRARPISARESYAAELDLLRRARVAYSSRDFSDALALIAEHRRRFPNGRLAEEREALRVQSLAGAGRTDEAARAAAAFAARFPRSVLLPRMRAEE